jgi:hypothetical protein
MFKGFVRGVSSVSITAVHIFVLLSLSGALDQLWMVMWPPTLPFCPVRCSFLLLPGLLMWTPCVCDEPPNKCTAEMKMIPSPALVVGKDVEPCTAHDQSYVHPESQPSICPLLLHCFSNLQLPFIQSTLLKKRVKVL